MFIVADLVLPPQDDDKNNQTHQSPKNYYMYLCTHIYEPFHHVSDFLVLIYFLTFLQ